MRFFEILWPYRILWRAEGEMKEEESERVGRAGAENKWPRLPFNWHLM